VSKGKRRRGVCGADTELGGKVTPQKTAGRTEKTTNGGRIKNGGVSEIQKGKKTHHRVQRPGFKKKGGVNANTAHLWLRARKESGRA